MTLFSFLSGKKEPLKFPVKTDIHCHIIPGVDDGSPDIETSVALVEREQNWGIERIIATPHITDFTFPNTPDTLDPALDELRAALEARGTDVTLSRASENRIDDFFKTQLEAGLITTYPGGYILVENSFVQEPLDLDRFLFDLIIKGYKPVLAHPERYHYYFEHPERYDTLHRAGTLFQINVLSLAGAYSKTEKKVAEKLIEKGYVDFLGTDLHNFRHADAIDAYLTTKDAARHFAALEGRLLNDKVFA